MNFRSFDLNIVDDQDASDGRATYRRVGASELVHGRELGACVHVAMLFGEDGESCQNSLASGSKV